MSESGKDGAIVASGQDQHGFDVPSLERHFILPPWARRCCFGAGVLVAYSQFAALAFASFFRYVYPYQENPDGYIGDRYVAWGLPSPEAWVGTLRNLSPIDPAIFLLEGAIAALLGSVGLFCFAYARKTWRAPRRKLIIVSAIGGTMPIVILLFETLRGFQRWYEFRYDEIYLSESYPMHGAFEFVCGVALPFVLYPILALWLIFRTSKFTRRCDDG